MATAHGALAAREPNRPGHTHRRVKQATAALRLSTAPLQAASSPAAAAATTNRQEHATTPLRPPADTPRTPAQQGWLEVRAVDARLADGRFFCVLPVGGPRLECFRDEAAAAAAAAAASHGAAAAIELPRCGCIHAEDLDDSGAPGAADDYHFCLGTSAGSVLFWAPRADGRGWIGALQAALAATPAFKQSPPPLPLLPDGTPLSRATALPTPVRSSPCVTPAAVRRLAQHTSSASPARSPETGDRSQRDAATANAVAAPPTWLPDDDVTECPLCDQSFGFFARRHHCRCEHASQSLFLSPFLPFRHVHTRSKSKSKNGCDCPLQALWWSVLFNML